MPWREGWFFLSLSDQLAADGQHVTVDLPDLSITVQNFRGALSGFWNVCSHRGMQMRPAGCGFGHLRCPYHGWVYNREGIPVGIPGNAELFGLDADERRSLALRAVNVATIGSLVFVCVEPTAGSLADTLGAAAGPLAASTLTKEQVVAERRLHVSGPGLNDLPGLMRGPPAAPVCRNLHITKAGDWTVLLAAFPDGPKGINITVALYAPWDSTRSAPPAEAINLFSGAVDMFDRLLAADGGAEE